MKNYLKLSAWLFLIPALMFSSCKDDDKSDGDPLLAPRNLVGLAGDGQVILNWDAPLSGEVKEYSVTWTPGNGSATVSGMAYTATGLTNDTEYTFSVKAVYASGSSDALTVKKTPKTEAINYTACTDVAAQAGYKAITLTWAVPEIVPKAELSGYTITVAPGEMEPIKVADPQAVSAVIDELANGTEYTVTIIADYKDGGMSAGVSVKATPTELISKVESDNVSKISFDKENAAIELYYTRPVDVKAIPVTFTLIEGATIDNESGAVSKTLNLKDPATVDVVMNDFTVPGNRRSRYARKIAPGILRRHDGQRKSRSSDPKDPDRLRNDPDRQIGHRSNDRHLRKRNVGKSVGIAGHDESVERKRRDQTVG